MIELFGSLTSPFVRHCRVALLQEGLPFSLTPTDMSQSAVQSPAMRVPFMRDGALLLTDSFTILHHVRGHGGVAWLADVHEAERFCLANTALDTEINLFRLEQDGVTPETTPYMQRQRARVRAVLSTLEQCDLEFHGAPGDGLLRIGCLLEWAVFRDRFSLTGYKALQRLVSELQRVPHWIDTAPPV